MNGSWFLFQHSRIRIQNPFFHQQQSIGRFYDYLALLTVFAVLASFSAFSYFTIISKRTRILAFASAELTCSGIGSNTAGLVSPYPIVAILSGAMPPSLISISFTIFALFSLNVWLNSGVPSAEEKPAMRILTSGFSLNTLAFSATTFTPSSVRVSFSHSKCASSRTISFSIIGTVLRITIGSITGTLSFIFALGAGWIFSSLKNL